MRVAQKIQTRIRNIAHSNKNISKEWKRFEIENSKKIKAKLTKYVPIKINIYEIGHGFWIELKMTNLNKIYEVSTCFNIL